MSSHRAVMALALLAAAGVDAAGVVRAARQAEAEANPTPAPPAKEKAEPVIDWYRRREREERARKRGRRGR